ncbi:hypothetical protein [Streptomyces cyaneus]|uniref:hypothetical protein n=1 Tax=Streptomyces cyaneus TaxID=1904 RepID=UPI000FF89951|nr:hypothetical protein [Streptomyces cyaneus]
MTADLATKAVDGRAAGVAPAGGQPGRPGRGAASDAGQKEPQDDGTAAHDPAKVFAEAARGEGNDTAERLPMELKAMAAAGQARLHRPADHTHEESPSVLTGTCEDIQVPDPDTCQVSRAG